MAVDDQYTVSLMHFDGNLNDESGKTWTAYGGATTSAAAAKFGSGGLLLDGVDDYLVTPSNMPAVTGDLTWEAWWNPSSATIGACPFVAFNASMQLQPVGSSNAYYGLYDGTDRVTSFVPTVGTTNHFAYVYIAATNLNSLYANGNLLLQWTKAQTFSLSARRIGKHPNDSAALYSPGKLDEMRYSLCARYTGDTYTVPTAAFGSASAAIYLPQPIFF